MEAKGGGKTGKENGGEREDVGVSWGASMWEYMHGDGKFDSVKTECGEVRLLLARRCTVLWGSILIWPPIQWRWMENFFDRVGNVEIHFRMSVLEVGSRV